MTAYLFFTFKKQLYMKKLILALAILTSSMVKAQNNTYQLSSHILDISTGLPAAAIVVQLEKQNSITADWEKIDEKITDQQGRIGNFLFYTSNNSGIYRLRFITAPYFAKQYIKSFYPFIEVVFQINDQQHYHVPITLSPYGYATYRGS